MTSAFFLTNALRTVVPIVALFAFLDHSMGNPIDLQQLRSEPKFRATKFYTGPDAPADGRALTSLVNRAIDDVLSFPAPADSTQVRTRLRKLIDDVDTFATEDREQAYRYVVRIWRAAGFTEPSNLFPVADERILQEP
jgi:hypothetical protein